MTCRENNATTRLIMEYRHGHSRGGNNPQGNHINAKASQGSRDEMFTYFTGHARVTTHDNDRIFVAVSWVAVTGWFAAAGWFAVQ